MAKAVDIGEVQDVQLQQTAIVSLTDNSGGTASDTVADLEATYTEATVANNFADVVAKINSILTALRNAQIIQ